MASSQILSGKRIVVIEDEPAIKMFVETALKDAGAGIATSFARKVDAAVLDVKIGDGVSSTPIAMTLEERRVPFLFYTGYADTVTAPLRNRWPGCKILPKPLPAHEL